MRANAERRPATAAQSSEPVSLQPVTEHFLRQLHKTQAAIDEGLLALNSDPRFLYLRDLLKTSDTWIDADGPKGERADEALRRATWICFGRELKSGMDDLRSSENVKSKEQLLETLYNWAKSNHPEAIERSHEDDAGKSCGFHEIVPKDLAADADLPGSAFYVAPTRTEERQRPATVDVKHGRGETPDLTSHPPQPTLAPPHERLRQFHTKEVASGQVFVPMLTEKQQDERKKSSKGSFMLKSLDLQRARGSPSPGLFADPGTPTTATGGFTARSIASARDTPSPFPPQTRPGSAASSYQRPLTARSVRSSMSGHRPKAAIIDETSTFVEDGEIRSTSQAMAAYIIGSPDAPPKEPPTDAELRMEERWLYYRNREITDKLVTEEVRSVVQNWGERRARVEEEIARNAETGKYQSQFRRRAYVSPTGVWQDIKAAEVEPMERMTGRSSASQASGAPTSASRRVGAECATPRDPQCFDVTRAGPRREVRGGGWVGCLGPPNRVPKPPPPSARALQLLERQSKRTEGRYAPPRQPAAIAIVTTEGAGGPTGPSQQEGADEEATPPQQQERRRSFARDSRRPSQIRGDMASGGLLEQRRLSTSKSPVDPLTASSPKGADAALSKGRPAGHQWISLSPYTFHGNEPTTSDVDVWRRPDDTDELAGYCHPWWRTAHMIKSSGYEEEELIEQGARMDDMRFKQLQECEDIKRIFARCANFGIDPQFFDAALVMPSHRVTGAGVTMRPGALHLPSNPFYKDTKKKKGKKAKTKVKKKKAKST